MGFTFIPNQPILFDDDIQEGKNNDNSAYAQLLQAGDTMCVQLKSTAISENLIYPSDTEDTELVTDPNFADTATYWTLDTGWTDLGGGKVQFTGFPATILSQTLASPMNLGLAYRCTVICDELITGVISVFCGTSLVGKITEAGTHVFDFTHIGNDLIYLQQDPDNDVVADFTVSEFSIKSLTWTSANYDLTGNYEVLEQTVNSDFDTSADGWTLQGNVAFSPGVITKAAGASGFLRQTCPLVVNRLMHTVTIDVSFMSAGSMGVTFGNVSIGAAITTNGTYTYQYALPTTFTGSFGQDELVLVCDSASNAIIRSFKIERNVPQWEWTDNKLCRNTLSGLTTQTVYLNASATYINYRFTISNRTQGSINILTADGATENFSNNGDYNIFYGVSLIADFQIIASPDFDGCMTVFEVYEYSNDIEWVIVNTLGTEVCDQYPATIYNDYVTFCFNLGSLGEIDLGAGCYQVKVIDNTGSTDITSTTLISYSETTPVRISAWVTGKNTGIQDGFYWDDIFVMGQRIRLLRILPTWDVQGKDYVYSTGRNVSPAITKDKLYELFVDYLDEWAHDALVIQLFADEFEIDDVPYFTNLENYEPEWSKNMNRNLAQVRMTIKKKVSRLYKTLS
jgi:hypothetical protein